MSSRQPGGVDPALLVGDFLDARDLQTLPVLDGLHEIGRLQQRIVRARVQPGRAAAQALDVQRARAPDRGGSDR